MNGRPLGERAALELLAPARDLTAGLAAIDHGADAVYIGGPRFGARASAGNPVADIERLAHHAHLYGARVYVTLNTLLHDAELEAAQRLVHEVYAAGADALIVQDMGLLELDLPPIALHASTQTDNRTPAKVRFLEQVGFSQVVLARELDLAQIGAIAGATSLRLECFVHGALCVSYSGQCYISHAVTGRSANRGECAQLCRLPGSVHTRDGRVLAENIHPLNLRDLDRGAHLQSLVEAGVSAFKIEGRLKDMAYVKNITAHYRRLLDRVLARGGGRVAASAGRCHYRFEPDPAKTFNRGSSAYFLQGRSADLAAFETPKFAGEAIGRVRRVGRLNLEIDRSGILANGDGLSYFDRSGRLAGVRINRVEGCTLHLAAPAPGLYPGALLYRNHDQAFARQMEKTSAERSIPVVMRFGAADGQWVLQATDAHGYTAEARSAAVAVPPGAGVTPPDLLQQQLGRLGNTPFELERLECVPGPPVCVPVSQLNALRREVTTRLQQVRQDALRRPVRRTAVDPPVPYPAEDLDWRGNVLNRLARVFYQRHGVSDIAPGFEQAPPAGEVALMHCRHCLRHALGECPLLRRGVRPEPWVLQLGSHRFTLDFDCRACEMQVRGPSRRERQG